MDDSEIEQSRSPKRRRLDDDECTPRYGSPDELSAGLEYDHSHLERNNSRFRGRPSISRDIDYRASDSPDELDHTIPTPRESDDYDQSESVSRDGSSTPTPTPTPRARSPVTPKLKEAVFVPYREKTVLRGHKRGVAAVRFSPDGSMIASCCE